ncbi:MAG: hypothetical protein ACI9MR_001814 [Myxococcota bacterium]|jgi:hypothetical protein
MKWIGLLLLALGTGLAASYGAQNIEEVTELSNAKVRAQVLATVETKAKAAYCTTKPDVEGVEGVPVEVPTEADVAAVTALKEADGCKAADAGTSVEVLLERLQAAHLARKNADVADAASVAEARNAWLVASEKALVHQAWSDTGFRGNAPAGIGKDEPKEEAGTLIASRDSLLSVYCATSRADRGLDPLKEADGCKKRKYSTRVNGMMGLWKSLAQEAEAVMPYKRKALEATLIPRFDSPEAFEVELLAFQETVRVEKRATLLANGKAKLATLRAGAAPVPAVEAARKAWVNAHDNAMAPNAINKTLPRPPAPGVRLDGWLGGPGTIFFVGLVLIIAGVVVARRANKAAVMADPKSVGGKKPVDFGELLATVQSNVAALATTMEETAEPDSNDQTMVMESVEAFVRDDVERLIESRSRLIARYGMGAFAEIFGPFSSGERYLNRAWSTVVDKHWTEATSSMHKSAKGFAAAQEALAIVVANHAKKAA